MNRITLNMAVAFLVSIVPLAAQETTNAIPATDFKAFDLVVKRNIFNASRALGRDFAPRPRTDRTNRYETFSLLGAISYEKGIFAFFGGSSSEYRKTLGPDDSIAGYRIKEITYDHVSLAVSNEPPVELRVGAQMRREEDGPWAIAAHAETSTTSATDSGSEPAGSSDAENEILKRLMKKREQELNK